MVSVRLAAVLALVAGCVTTEGVAPPDAARACVPGEARACACGPRTGAIICDASRAWGACLCTEVDAGAPLDAPLATPDTGPHDGGAACTSTFCPGQTLPFEDAVYVYAQLPGFPFHTGLARILPTRSRTTLTDLQGDYVQHAAFDASGRLYTSIAGDGILPYPSGPPLWTPPCYAPRAFGWDRGGSLFYDCNNDVRRDDGVLLVGYDDGTLEAVLPSGRFIQQTWAPAILFDRRGNEVSRHQEAPGSQPIPHGTTVNGEQAFVPFGTGPTAVSVVRADADTGRWHFVRAVAIPAEVTYRGTVLALSDGRVLVSCGASSGQQAFVVAIGTDGSVTRVWSDEDDPALDFGLDAPPSIFVGPIDALLP